MKKILYIAIAVYILLLTGCKYESYNNNYYYYGSKGNNNIGDKKIEGALPGVFSISDDEKVCFSKGNLQATYNGTGYDWGFAANQWDYIGDAPGNTTMKNQSSGDVVDLFGWTARGMYDDKVKEYGINISTVPEAYGVDPNDECCDWGETIDSEGTWRILTIDEWNYLFKNNKYRNGVYVCGHRCVVLVPDSWDADIPIAGSYDEESWAVAEAAGAVCLPSAEWRESYGVHVWNQGYYWSSSPNGVYAYYLLFDSTGVYRDLFFSRIYGLSVRLVAPLE